MIETKRVYAEKRNLLALREDMPGQRIPKWNRIGWVRKIWKQIIRAVGFHSSPTQWKKKSLDG